MATIRPVFSHYITVLGIIFYIVFVICSQFRSFKKVMVCLFIIFLPLSFFDANAAKESSQKDNSEFLRSIEKSMALMKAGKLEKKQRLKLAENLLKANEHKKALRLYSENIKNFEEEDIGTLINYGVAFFKNKKIAEGMNVYDQIFRLIENDKTKLEQYGEILQTNILLSLKENKNKSESNDNKDQQKKNNKNEDSKKGKNNKGKDKKEQDKQKKKNDNEKKKEQENNKQDEQKKKNQQQQNEDSDKKKDAKKQNPEEALADKERNIKKKRKTMKIPAVIKNLMHKDRKLQKKYFNTQTKKNKQTKKDW